MDGCKYHNDKSEGNLNKSNDAIEDSKEYLNDEENGNDESQSINNTYSI